MLAFKKKKAYPFLKYFFLIYFKNSLKKTVIIKKINK